MWLGMTESRTKRFLAPETSFVSSELPPFFFFFFFLVNSLQLEVIIKVKYELEVASYLLLGGTKTF
jgi:hypothetical protein